MTFSFWVKSALTGDYGFYVFKDDAGRAYQTTYSISDANTWEYKTITVPGDTSGAISDDNGVGFEVRWYLGAGSDKAGSSSQNAWGTNAANRHPTGTNIMASTSNDWFITGVQLEVGEKATPFEHRSYGDELARCQRYYYKYAEGASKDIGVGAFYNSTLFAFSVNFPVSMRAAPTFDYVTGTDYYGIFRAGALDPFDAMSATRLHENSAAIDTSTGTSGTQGHGGIAQTSNASAYIAFSAEL